MDNTSTALAQRSLEKLHFDHQDMDFYLSWIMGRTVYEGAAVAECLAVAARIPNADAAAWRREWRALAQQVEAEARAALDRGDLDVARRGYLRACTYYRAPLFITPPSEPSFRADTEKMRACFQQAAALFDPPIETVTVTYQGVPLLGYIWPAGPGRQPRPTLIVAGGIETFAEDCVFMIGSAGAERGYHVLTVDLPGQGLNPDHGLYFGARMEQPVARVVDYALSRPEVDGSRLALFGFSWGGHVAFKAGQHEPRLKALIANPAMPDVFRAVLAQQKGHNRADPLSRMVFDQIVWRMGLRISFHPRDIARRMGKAYDYFFRGRADPAKIACPVLCLAGEGEAAITLQIARECFARLPHPKKKLVIFTRDQGGEAHCQVNNLALPNTTMFDWLADVFSR